MALRAGGRWVWWTVGGGALLAAVGIGTFVAGRAAERPPSWASIRAAADQERWPEVEAALVRWLASHPDDPDARLMLGMTRMTLRREDEARATLAAIAPGHPAHVAAQNLLGQLELKRKHAAAAERAFRVAADADPEAGPPRNKLIYLLSLQMRNAEVRERLWELHRISNDPRTLVDLVMALFAWENDVRGLGPELEELLKATPEDPYLRRAWGLGLLLRGRPATALPHLEAAAARLDEDPVGRAALVEAQMLMGTFDGDLDAALGQAPKRPADAARWYVTRARLEESFGRLDAARSSLEQALAVQPDDREAHFRLGQLLPRLGDEAGAKEHAARAEAIRARENAVRREHDRLRRQGFDSDPALFERLGVLCRDAGMIDEARAWFKHAIRLDPTRSSAQAALAATPERPGSLPFFLARPVPMEPGRLADRRPTPRVLPAAPSPAAAEVRFEDVAATAGLDLRYDAGVSDRLLLPDTMGGGVGLIDYDGDGWLDVYLVNGCPLPFDAASPPAPNRLYRNRRDGTFEDVTTRAGVAGRGYGMGCAVGDYDGDGHDDLYVTGLRDTVLYRNRGDGTFEDVTARAGVESSRWTTAAGFADLDGDADLDLVVVTYVEDRLDPGRICRDHANHPIHCSPKLYPDQPDHLFRNNGDGTFTDVAAEAGFEGPDGRGLGLALADFDEDGKLDVFVANDASADFLFHNEGGLRFAEVGQASGVAFDGMGRATASMGVAADDLNADGKIDLFHTNFQNEPNTLLLNLGAGQFADGTLAAGLEGPSWAKTGFGTAALDADNDGRLDLFVANGQVDDQPWINSPMAQEPQLYLGRDGGRFALASPETSAYLSRSVVGRGLACGDLDNDGRLDLIVVHRDAPVAVLHNTTTGGGHWLGLRLRGKASGPMPVGARVTCQAGGHTWTRWWTSGTGYLSAHDPRIWIGLGGAEKVDRLEIRWPSGHVQACAGPEPDRIYQAVEGTSPDLTLTPE